MILSQFCRVKVTKTQSRFKKSLHRFSRILNEKKIQKKTQKYISEVIGKNPTCRKTPSQYSFWYPVSICVRNFSETVYGPTRRAWPGTRVLSVSKPVSLFYWFLPLMIFVSLSTRNTDMSPVRRRRKNIESNATSRKMYLHFWPFS